MATVGERLATVESELKDVRQDLTAVLDLLNGGANVDYTRSVRGRLHKIEGDLAALLMLRRASMRFVSRGWRVVIGVCAILTAAAPYVLYFASR